MGGGTNSPKSKKFFVGKWCCFQKLYKMTKFLEDRIENWEVIFPLRFLYVNFKIVIKNFKPLVFTQNSQNVAARVVLVRLVLSQSIGPPHEVPIGQ